MLSGSTFSTQMKHKRIWSTAVAAAATTSTVLVCSPCHADLHYRFLSFASALTPSRAWNLSDRSSTGLFGSTTMRLSSFSTVLHATSSSLSPNTTHCKESEELRGENTSVVVTKIPFDDSILTYDHYNGVTLHLDKYNPKDMSDGDSFATRLNNALTIWKAEGRKGIWIHASTKSAKYIPDCTDAGFQFHKILPKRSETPIAGNCNSHNALVLSQWLPTDIPSRLPHGPTHQVGVGVILLNPLDPSEMLVVKELTGPAAKYNLWKMPTGLVDPQEYVHEAASRELFEETGIEATMSGILCIRQAHRSNADTSDMFFVCKMTSKTDIIQWKKQEAEIAEIRWMPVQEYCDQDRWQGSPLYETLNDCVRKASIQELEHRREEESDANPRNTVVTSIAHQQLEVGFGRSDGKTEALFLLENQSHDGTALSTETNSKL